MKENRQKVFDKLIQYLAAGNLGPNLKLPSENTLAQNLDVKRSDVREAIIALETIGVIRTRQGKGSYLSAFELSEGANPFSLMFMLKEANPNEIMHMRILLETESARLCAMHCTNRELRQLGQSLEALKATERYADRAQEDAAFHSIIAKSCTNQLLRTLIHFVFGYISHVSLLNWEMLSKPENETQRNAIIRQHESIYCAIRGRDPQGAARSIREHLLYIQENLNQTIREEYQRYEEQNRLLWF